MEKMKAAIYNKYGAPEVLQVTEVDKPQPKDDEVLIKVYSTTVTRGDTRMRGFNVPFWLWLPSRLYLGVFKPKKPILGMELSGVVESTGSKTKRFKKGDAVFAAVGMNFGANAEYKCIRESGKDATEGLISHKPSNLSFEEAAAVPTGSLAALLFLRIAKVKKGQKVLIYGASGSVGTYAVQLAKIMGAHVTAVCSTSNINLVKSLGADKVIDYTKEDLRNTEDRFDLVFDTVGKAPRPVCKQLLYEKGIFLSTLDLHDPNSVKTDDLDFIKDLVECGRLKPVIDKVYPLEQIVDAHRHVDTGHKKGNVVISIVNKK